MVYVQSLMINQQRFNLITIKLPGLTTRLIYCTHGILFDECWQMDTILQRCHIPVAFGSGKSDEALLENTLRGLSKEAKDKGILLSMKGREALLAMADKT